MFDPTGPGAKQRAETLKSVVNLVKASISTLAQDVKSLDETVSRELCFVLFELCLGPLTVFLTGRAGFRAHPHEEVRDHDYPQRQIPLSRPPGKSVISAHRPRLSRLIMPFRCSGSYGDTVDTPLALMIPMLSYSPRDDVCSSFAIRSCAFSRCRKISVYA